MSYCCPACPCPLQPLSITLRGITNDAVDPSIDTWRTVALPLLRKAGGLDESSAGGSLELRVVRRGARPAGGGEVQLRVPLVRQLPRVVMTDEGMVKRIRGISYSMKVGGRLQQRGWRLVSAERSSCTTASSLPHMHMAFHQALQYAACATAEAVPWLIPTACAAAVLTMPGATTKHKSHG